jgi:hypothetical protein
MDGIELVILTVVLLALGGLAIFLSVRRARLLEKTLEQIAAGLEKGRVVEPLPGQYASLEFVHEGCPGLVRFTADDPHSHHRHSGHTDLVMKLGHRSRKFGFLLTRRYANVALRRLSWGLSRSSSSMTRPSAPTIASTRTTRSAFVSSSLPRSASRSWRWKTPAASTTCASNRSPPAFSSALTACCGSTTSCSSSSTATCTSSTPTEMPADPCGAYPRPAD